MSSESKPYPISIHVVGLGGTGVRILEAFVRSDRSLVPLLKIEGMKISLIAIDIVESEIQSLEDSYKELLERLKKDGIPVERLSLIAKDVKLAEGEAFTDFLRRLPDYLEREGEPVSMQFYPLVSATLDRSIHADSSGRSLSKTIYAQNYYHLRSIDSFMDSFKEQIFSSIIQPVVFIIYALGGGAGSGMALDFARHLRRKVGTGIPIVGLAILPCSGDEPTIKGVSAYAALLEHEAILERNRNMILKERFGDSYENPFSVFLMMPFDPIYRRLRSLNEAKNFVDKTVVDILANMLKFDLADLFANIGSNVDLKGRWVHVVSTFKVSYPIPEYMKRTDLYLQRLEKIRHLRRLKREILSGGFTDEVSGVRKILSLCYSDLKEIYKRILIERSIYDEGEFEDRLRQLLERDAYLELQYSSRVKKIEHQLNYVITDLSRPIRSITLDAAYGTVEARIGLLLTELSNLISNVVTDYKTFRSRAVGIAEDLRGCLIVSQHLTLRQIQLIEDLMELTQLLIDFLDAVRLHIECDILSDFLAKELYRAEKTKAHQEALEKVQRIRNPELIILRPLLSTIFMDDRSEVKTIDSILQDCRLTSRAIGEEREKLLYRASRFETARKSKEAELDTIRRELRRVRLGVFAGRKKKLLTSRASQLERELKDLAFDIDNVNFNLTNLDRKIAEYRSIESILRPGSKYRSLLAETSKLLDITGKSIELKGLGKSYYDRRAELTEFEQLRIMRKILAEEEDTLTNENILRDIVDRKHLREVLVSALSILKVPSTLGLTSEYKTDYIWMTVLTPRGIWDRDLESEAKTALAGYVNRDVSKTIVVREVDSRDPWAIRFLIVAGKAEPQMLQSYKEMKLLYDRASLEERLLSHSLLLEQGFYISENGEISSLYDIDQEQEE